MSSKTNVKPRTEAYHSSDNQWAIAIKNEERSRKNWEAMHAWLIQPTPKRTQTTADPDSFFNTTVPLTASANIGRQFHQGRLQKDQVQRHRKRGAKKSGKKSSSGREQASRRAGKDSRTTLPAHNDKQTHRRSYRQNHTDGAQPQRRDYPRPWVLNSQKIAVHVHEKAPKKFVSPQEFRRRGLEDGRSDMTKAMFTQRFTNQPRRRANFIAPPFATVGLGIGSPEPQSQLQAPARLHSPISRQTATPAKNRSSPTLASTHGSNNPSSRPQSSDDVLTDANNGLAWLPPSQTPAERTERVYQSHYPLTTPPQLPQQPSKMRAAPTLGARSHHHNSSPSHQHLSRKQYNPRSSSASSTRVASPMGMGPPVAFENAQPPTHTSSQTRQGHGHDSKGQAPDGQPPQAAVVPANNGYERTLQLGLGSGNRRAKSEFICL